MLYSSLGLYAHHSKKRNEEKNSSPFPLSTVFPLIFFLTYPAPAALYLFLFCTKCFFWSLEMSLYLNYIYKYIIHCTLIQILFLSIPCCSIQSSSVDRRRLYFIFGFSSVDQKHPFPNVAPKEQVVQYQMSCAMSTKADHLSRRASGGAEGRSAEIK
jgi:hypothetical protein